MSVAQPPRSAVLGGSNLLINARACAGLNTAGASARWSLEHPMSTATQRAASEIALRPRYTRLTARRSPMIVLAGIGARYRLPRVDKIAARRVLRLSGRSLITHAVKIVDVLGERLQHPSAPTSQSERRDAIYSPEPNTKSKSAFRYLPSLRGLRASCGLWPAQGSPGRLGSSLK